MPLITKLLFLCLLAIPVAGCGPSGTVELPPPTEAENRAMIEAGEASEAEANSPDAR